MNPVTGSQRSGVGGSLRKVMRVEATNTTRSIILVKKFEKMPSVKTLIHPCDLELGLLDLFR